MRRLELLDPRDRKAALRKVIKGSAAHTANPKDDNIMDLRQPYTPRRRGSGPEPIIRKR